MAVTTQYVNIVVGICGIDFRGISSSLGLKQLFGESPRKINSH